MAAQGAPVVSARVERGLFDAARRAAGLPDDATQGQVVRYALAVLAGERDPRSVAIVPTGFLIGPDPRRYRPREALA
jgi:hypothetical protein